MKELIHFGNWFPNPKQSRPPLLWRSMLISDVLMGLKSRFLITPPIRPVIASGQKTR
jgi:hypothetical protein